MIVYRYLVSNSPIEVYNALVSDNRMRVKIGINCGYESSVEGWIRDGCWEMYEDPHRTVKLPNMEYLLLPKGTKTEIQLSFHYNSILTTYVDTLIYRTDKRRELFENVLRKKLKNFTKLKMLTLQELIAKEK